MLLSSLLQVINAETVLCQEIGRVMGAMLSAVMEKRPADVQKQLQTYQELSAGLAQAEAVRTRYFEQACELHRCQPAHGMSRLVSLIDPALRPAFTKALREFRMAVYLMRSLSRNLETYTGSQLITLDSFLAELMPQRDSGVYSASGSRAASTRPMLVDSLS